MAQEIDQEIDPSCYTYKPPPKSHEILAALVLQLAEPPLNIKLPQDEQKLAEGLLAATKKVTNLGLRRFVNVETGQLTDAARTSLETLKAEGTLVTEGESFIIPLNPPTIRQTINSRIRMSLSNVGTASLRQAAEAVGNIWSPQ